MSDVQRYMMKALNYGAVEATPADNGYWVDYADHVAAVAAAEQEAGEQAHGHYMDGYHAGVKAARDAVAALIDKQPTTAPGWVRRDEALAAIDGVKP